MATEREAEAAAFPWTFLPELAPGKRRAEYFTWPGERLAGRRWPFFALRGVAPGPAVAITAGVHGGEYPGPLAAIALGRELDPAALRGSLLILPLINLPAFWARSAFVTPDDGLNLNRAFPGREDGSFSEALAYRLLHDVIAPAEVVIDLHSGDLCETLTDHTGRYHSDDPAIAARNEALAASFGLPYAEGYAAPTASRSLTGSAAMRGKATLLLEVGGNGMVREANLTALRDGLHGALRALGMLPGTPPESAATPIVGRAQVAAPVTGLWRAAVEREQRVAAGDVLGTITDLLGEPLAELVAPCDGMVLYYLASLAAHEGDPLVYLVDAV